jgi:hypothetical protein
MTGKLIPRKRVSWCGITELGLGMELGLGVGVGAGAGAGAGAGGQLVKLS